MILPSKDPEVLKKALRKWREKNREKIRIAQREDYAKNPERFIRYRKENDVRIKKLLLDRKMMVFSVYSKRLSNSKTPCCACCRENYSHEFLAIDHINGRKIHGHKKGWGGTAMYHWLEKNNYPDGFQVLCHNCNIAKGVFGICPHQK